MRPLVRVAVVGGEHGRLRPPRRARRRMARPLASATTPTPSPPRTSTASLSFARQVRDGSGQPVVDAALTLVDGKGRQVGRSGAGGRRAVRIEVPQTGT